MCLTLKDELQSKEKNKESKGIFYEQAKLSGVVDLHKSDQIEKVIYILYHFMFTVYSLYLIVYIVYYIILYLIY